LVIGLGGTTLFFITIVLIHKPILLSIGDFLVVNEENLQPADMIHVLGGCISKRSYAVKLYQQGYSQQFFITGSRWAKYKKQAISQGVQPDDIVSPRSAATSTYEEALELKRFLDNDASVQSIIIVSSPHHMRRAQWIFNKVPGNRVSLQFASVPFDMSPHTRQWWTDSETAKIVMSEYLKIFYYWLKY
jgi:uncharacterized SAM-binding protein YcdF (DUF218 family)